MKSLRQAIAPQERQSCLDESLKKTLDIHGVQAACKGRRVNLTWWTQNAFNPPSTASKILFALNGVNAQYPSQKKVSM